MASQSHKHAAVKKPLLVAGPDAVTECPLLGPSYSTIYCRGSPGAGTSPEGQLPSLHLTQRLWDPTVFPGRIRELCGTMLLGLPVPSCLLAGGAVPSQEHPGHLDPSEIRTQAKPCPLGSCMPAPARGSSPHMEVFPLPPSQGSPSPLHLSSLCPWH